MRAFLSFVLIVAAAASAFTGTASAQGGYTTEKHADLGLTFPRARDYEQIPTQPDEEFVVLHYAEKLPKDPKERPKAVRPEFYVLWIDHVPDAPAKTKGDPNPEGPVPRGGTGSDDAGDDGQPKRPPINSIDRYVDQRWPMFGMSQPSDPKMRQGWTGREYTLAPRKGVGQLKAGGWVMAYSKPERTIAFVGIGPVDDMDKQNKIWRAMAEKVDFDEPEELSTAKLQTMYARSKLADVPYRIGVRQKLVRGWKAEDLEHYIVVYDSVDQPMMRKVFRDIELIRKEYEKLFPSDKPVTAVSTVRVCKNREEYLAYGGMPGSAGYWNSSTEELVLYDAETVSKDGKKSDADTFIVLYHEAFHQYIHYSAGELPPHSWYNEGHGDFFSGATIKDGKMRGIGVNPWRVQYIKDVIGVNKSIPWSEIIEYEQPQYYDKTKIGICYAQGWSMIYFLRTSKDVAAKPEWAKILPTYFNVLKTTYLASCAELEAAGKKDDAGAHNQAGYEARQRAVKEAFDGVDLKQLEEAWRIYTLGLETPKDK